MPKKILLIENDSAFAAQLSESLEASGFDVRIAPEGKAGLDLAREWGPDAVVLCVELPGMSGYLVCQKLRKEDATKGIPLILTSAEATPDTFEKHRALKVRADEYLSKPYVPGALLEKLAAIGLSAEVAPAPARLDDEDAGPLPDDEPDEEVVTLEEDMGLEALAAEPEAELPALNLESLPDEPLPGGGEQPSLDEDLSLLDEAFDGISSHPPARPNGDEGLDLELPGEAPVPPEDVDAAAGSPLDGDEAPGLGALDGALELETDDALAGLGGDGDGLGTGAFELDREPVRPSPALRPASAGGPRASGTSVKVEPEPPRPVAAAPAAPARAVTPVPAPAPATANGGAMAERLGRELAEARQALSDARSGVSAREAELRQLRARAERSARRADEAEAAISEKDADLASLRAKLETVTGQARRAEAELKTVREEGRRAADELADLRGRLAEVEGRAEAAEAEARRRAEEASESTERLEGLERELEELRTELVVARGEAEGARGEVEKRTAELRKKLAELEAANAKNEERVLKAYQKIKSDEKVKDKVRKAVAIAAQLLEEGLPPDAVEKERRPGPATLLDRD
jgi:CheY-like chemotaxis protein